MPNRFKQKLQLLRKDRVFQGVRRTQTKDQYNLVTGIDEVMFDIEGASYHPITGRDQKNLPEGYRDVEAFILYCDTPVRPAQEGTDILADRVIITRNDGTTLTTEVLQVKDWNNDVLEHYQAKLVKINER